MSTEYKTDENVYFEKKDILKLWVCFDLFLIWKQTLHFKSINFTIHIKEFPLEWTFPLDAICKNEFGWFEGYRPLDHEEKYLLTTFKGKLPLTIL